MGAGELLVCGRFSARLERVGRAGREDVRLRVPLLGVRRVDASRVDHARAQTTAVRLEPRVHMRHRLGSPSTRPNATPVFILVLWLC